MARISSYAVDSGIVTTDKVLGTDSQGLTTKNFSFSAVKDWLNSSAVVGVVGQNTYTFQTIPGNPVVRDSGSISLPGLGGDGTAFADITSMVFSERAVDNSVATNYINTLIGKQVVLMQLDNLDNFGIYNLDSFTPLQGSPGFYTATLSVDYSNGNLISDQNYGFAVYGLQSAGATWGAIQGTVTNQTDLVNYIDEEIANIPAPATPTLQSVTDEGNTTTNAISAGTITANNELHLVDSAMRIFRSSNDMRFRTNNSDNMTITDTGNVGIGITNPTAKLEIASDNGWNEILFSRVGGGSHLANITSTSSMRLETTNSPLNIQTRNQVNPTINILPAFNISTTSGTINLGTSTKTSLDTINLYGNTYASGSVGIGTTAPAYGLDIHKNGDAFRVANAGGFDMFSVRQVADQASAYTADVAGNAQIYSNFNSTYNYQSFSALYARGFKGQGANNAIGVRAVRAEHGLGFGAVGSLEYSRGVESKFSTLSTGAGTINNIYGFYNSAANSGVTINNQYGLYLSDTPVATTNYGVYQAGSTFKNVFEGNVGIGTTAPNHLFSVNNKFMVTSTGSAFIPAGQGIGIDPYSGGAATNIYFNTGNVQVGGVTDFIHNNASFIVKNSGNVGIGTTEPGSTLPSDAESGSKILQLTGVSGSSGDTAILLRSSDNSSGFDLWHNASSGDSYIDNRYFYGDTIFRVRTASTPNEVVRITPDGNVGIGTTAPAAKLDVDGSIYPTRPNGGTLGLLQFKEWSYVATPRITGNNNRMELLLSGETVVLKDHNTIGDGIQIKNRNNVVAQFGDANGSGKVGIGTTAPSGKLHITTDSINNQYGVYIDKPAGIAGNLFYAAEAGGSNYQLGGSSNFKLGYGNTFTFQATGTGGAIRDALKINVDSTLSYPHLVMQEDGGNVGIGTTSPVEKVHINGNLRLGLAGSTGHYISWGQNEVGSTGDFARIQGIRTDAAGNQAGHLTFQTKQSLSGTAPAERLRITDIGNVGIGTTAPTEKLEVVGKMVLKDAGGSVYIGELAGTNDNAVGRYNVGIGDYALNSNTSGYNNVAIGSSAMYNSTSGFRNVALGVFALGDNVSGHGNTAIGYSANTLSTEGYMNVAVGYEALENATTAYWNTAVGAGALQNSDAPASDNTAVGFYAMNLLTTGRYNTSLGTYALSDTELGSDNTAVGYYAGGGDYQGTQSVYLGMNTSPNSWNETNQIVIGYGASGNGSNSVTLGNASITKTILRGNVGIGTTAPSTLLHLRGDSPTLRIEADGANESSIIELVQDGGVTGAAIKYNGASNIEALQFNTGVSDTRMTIKRATGNVGIGTTAPSSKVHINGTAMEQLRMETQGGPVNAADAKGSIGDMAYDADFFYIKTSNGWGRVPLDFGF